MVDWRCKGCVTIISTSKLEGGGGYPPQTKRRRRRRLLYFVSRCSWHAKGTRPRARTHLGGRLDPQSLDVGQKPVVVDAEVAEGDVTLLLQRGHFVDAHHRVVRRLHLGLPRPEKDTEKHKKKTRIKNHTKKHKKKNTERNECYVRQSTVILNIILFIGVA